jgi:hypothetical protein
MNIEDVHVQRISVLFNIWENYRLLNVIIL